METPNGTKRTIGFIMMLLPLVSPYVGFEVSEAAPVEIAAHIEGWVQLFGAAVLLWGEWKAKRPMWFAKINK